MIRSAAASLLSLAIIPVSVQTPQAPNTDIKPLAYEIVSIKPNRSGGNSGSYGFRPDGIYGTNVPLTSLLYNGVRSQQVYGAPDWLQSDHYDFEAKVAESDLTA